MVLNIRITGSKFIALLGLWLFLSSPAALAGESVVITDGDTLRIGDERIRLWGIDAPEVGQICSRDGEEFACGTVARDVLRGLIGGDDLDCRAVEKDRYGRTIARCMVGSSDLGSLMVLSGWALDFERYSGGYYALEQRKAEKAKRGLWGGDFIPPWEWRRRI